MRRLKSRFQRDYDDLFIRIEEWAENNSVNHTELFSGHMLDEARKLIDEGISEDCDEQSTQPPDDYEHSTNMVRSQKGSLRNNDS